MPAPVIGIMLGDTTGIGPEVAAKVLAAHAAGSTDIDARLLVIGDRRVMEMGIAEAGVSLPLRQVASPAAADWSQPGIPMIDLGNIDPAALGRGRALPESGRLTGETLKMMIDMALRRELDAVCFAPLNKAALHAGGWKYHDEHQMFAALVGHKGFFGEMNVVPQFSTFRVTSHVPMKVAMEMITAQRITDAVHLAERTLRATTGKDRPKIGVAALNPHGGEGGLFGREEIELITPTLDALRAEGVACVGPIPADVIFIRALKGEFDGVVSMYHDQGQVATKLLNFNKGVTVTAGLDVVFATPAHGTAFDIVGQGIADPGAMTNAVSIAARLAVARQARMAAAAE